MNKAIIGRKIGMTRLFAQDGKMIPVTVVEAGPCPVVQVKTTEHDGYAALKLGFIETSEKALTKPELGQFKKANVKPCKVLKEIRVDNAQGSYVPKTITAGGAWMGGGLNNYDYAELNATDVSYKIIARGWMDLCNPGAGYDSASAGTKVALKVGENHDYTIYLQPNLYTVKEGHKLALVIYTYEPGKANYSQDYQITLENASVSAEIPVDKIPAVPALPFTDVPADTELYAAVKWAYFSAPQITVGVTETTFAPASTCTRAEVVTFLYRLAGEPDVSGTALPFTDVAEDAYYTDAVKWAAANGVTAGTSATTFSPNDTCTRAQAVTLLYNAAGAPAVSDTVSFADVAADAYYADAVAWAAANGVTVGTSATTFSPDDACTRGQIVCMLYRGDTQA